MTTRVTYLHLFGERRATLGSCLVGRGGAVGPLCDGTVEISADLKWLLALSHLLKRLKQGRVRPAATAATVPRRGVRVHAVSAAQGSVQCRGRTVGGGAGRGAVHKRRRQRCVVAGWSDGDG